MSRQSVISEYDLVLTSHCKRVGRDAGGVQLDAAISLNEISSTLSVHAHVHIHVRMHACIHAHRSARRDLLDAQYAYDGGWLGARDGEGGGYARGGGGGGGCKRGGARCSQPAVELHCARGTCCHLTPHPSPLAPCPSPLAPCPLPLAPRPLLLDPRPSTLDPRPSTLTPLIPRLRLAQHGPLIVPSNPSYVRLSSRRLRSGP